MKLNVEISEIQKIKIKKHEILILKEERHDKNIIKNIKQEITTRDKGENESWLDNHKGVYGYPQP